MSFAPPAGHCTPQPTNVVDTCPMGGRSRVCHRRPTAISTRGYVRRHAGLLVHVGLPHADTESLRPTLTVNILPSMDQPAFQTMPPPGRNVHLGKCT
eukprot:363927-Chlamydomonas_euryale.AAC.5